MSIFDKIIIIRAVTTGCDELHSLLSLARWLFTSSEDLRKLRAEDDRFDWMSTREFSWELDSSEQMMLVVKEYEPGFVYREDEQGIGDYGPGQDWIATYEIILNDDQSAMWDRISHRMQERRLDI